VLPSSPLDHSSILDYTYFMLSALFNPRSIATIQTCSELLGLEFNLKRLLKNVKS
jgi:hypothetical protein